MADTYGPNIITTLAKRLKPFIQKTAGGVISALVQEGPGIDLVPGAEDLVTVGIGGDSILILHADGSPASEYARTALATALAAAVSGDVVQLPAGTIPLKLSGCVPGAEIATGAITPSNSSGHVISGLTIGTWYAVESFTGYFKLGDGWQTLNSDFQLSNGAGFSGNVGQSELFKDSTTGIDETLNPSFCYFSECFDGADTKRYGRTYFQATTTSISVRAADTDTEFWNNTGTLS